MNNNHLFSSIQRLSTIHTSAKKMTSTIHTTVKIDTVSEKGCRQARPNRVQIVMCLSAIVGKTIFLTLACSASQSRCVGAAADFQCATPASPPPRPLRPSGRHVRLLRQDLRLTPPPPSYPVLLCMTIYNSHVTSLFSQHQSFPTNRKRGAAA